MAKNLIEEVEDLMDILKMRIDKLKKSFDRLDTVVRLSIFDDNFIFRGALKRERCFQMLSVENQKDLIKMSKVFNSQLKEFLRTKNKNMKVITIMYNQGLDELKSLRADLNILEENFNEKKKKFKFEIELEDERKKIEIAQNIDHIDPKNVKI